uniref:Uncharacterized protein n=1 Tax=Cannabis sativa TaxID=3483 RepID=A0A803QDG6_CANSA
LGLSPGPASGFGPGWVGSESRLESDSWPQSSSGPSSVGQSWVLSGVECVSTFLSGLGPRKVWSAVQCGSWFTSRVSVSVRFRTKSVLVRSGIDAGLGIKSELVWSSLEFQSYSVWAGSGLGLSLSSGVGSRFFLRSGPKSSSSPGLSSSLQSQGLGLGLGQGFSHMSCSSGSWFGVWVSAGLSYSRVLGNESELRVLGRGVWRNYRCRVVSQDLDPDHGSPTHFNSDLGSLIQCSVGVGSSVETRSGLGSQSQSRVQCPSQIPVLDSNLDSDMDPSLRMRVWVRSAGLGRVGA